MCAEFLCSDHTGTSGICVITCILSFVDMYCENVVCKLIFLLHIGLFGSLTCALPT